MSMIATPSLETTKTSHDFTAACNACGAEENTPFFSAPQLPVHVGVFYDDATAARNAPKGSIELAFCHRCGHVFNRRFDPEQVRYQPGYEVALHYSPTFRSFMESVANRLIEKEIIDIDETRALLGIPAGMTSVKLRKTYPATPDQTNPTSAA